MQRCLQVFAFALPGIAVCRAAKKLLKEIAETAAVPGTAAEIAKPLETTETKTLGATPVCARVALLRFELLAVLPVLAILIISPALLGIAQHLVCFVDLLEFGFGLRVILVKVGVVSFCQSAVRLFYLILRSALFHAQNLVIINECHTVFGL